MKKIVKLITVIMFMILLISVFTVSYGFNVKDLTGTQTQIDTLKNAGNSVAKVITAVGIVISVIALVILGIKYMIGSVEEKAEYKKTLIPYVIGAGLVFASSVIAQTIYDIAIKL